MTNAVALLLYHRSENDPVQSHFPSFVDDSSRKGCGVILHIICRCNYI
jgi:hypothetical protein